MSIQGSGPNYTDVLNAGAIGGTWSNANPQTVDIVASDGTTVLFSGQFFVASPNPPPTVTSCSPNSVPKNKTNTVTVNGTNFISGRPNDDVSISGGNFTTITVTRSHGYASSISVTTTNSTGGPYTVTVTNPMASLARVAGCMSVSGP